MLRLELALFLIPAASLVPRLPGVEALADAGLSRAQRELLQQTAPDVSQSVCGATEYFCGDSDLVLDQAYSALQSPNCTLDSDLQVYICGDVIVTAAEQDAFGASKDSCQASCALSSAALAVPSQYYWAVSNWTACSASCNGGVATRTVSCMNSQSGGQAAASLCDSTSKPTIRRTCNATPCQVLQQGLALDFTSWSDCEANCGSGIAVREAFCTDPFGNLADVAACSAYAGARLSQACSSGPCDSHHWDAGAWGECSAVCGGGNATRPVTCIDGGGRRAAEAACNGADRPLDTRECGTQPCVGYTWAVGTWGQCGAACGGGVKNRTIQCVDQHGAPAKPSLCTSKIPADQLQCNVLPCDFCGQTTCAGQGVCKNDVCVCQPGYRGAYCEIPPQCSGILDAAGNCCDHGLVDINGTCCASAAVLDASARCCNGGRRDACGVCGGPARAVDVQGACCDSGVLDASGYCCESGALDECGVCDGDSQSCALSASVTVQVSTPAALFSLGPQAFATTFSRFASRVLGVNETDVDVADFSLVPGATVGAGGEPVNMQVRFSVNPADSFAPSQDLRASVATRSLQDAVGEASANQLFILLSLPSVQRVALCGNQVCEPGERPSPGSAPGCPGDCPFLLNACPAASANATPCAGNGRCLTATGTCVCFLGYTGDDCSQCAEGYMRAGSACARYVKADLPLLDQTSSANVLVVLAIGIALAVLGAALLAVAVVIIVRQRRQLRMYRKPRRRPSLKVPLRSAELKKGCVENGSRAASRRGSGASDIESEGGQMEDVDAERTPCSLSASALRVKSIVDLARLRNQGAATEDQAGGGSTSAAVLPASKPRLLSIKSFGQGRKAPHARESHVTNAAKVEESVKHASPSKVAEKAAFKRRLRLLENVSGSASRSTGDPAIADGGATVTITRRGKKAKEDDQ